MRIEEFKADDVAAYLNQKLPGFEPSILKNDRMDSITLKVNGAVRFSGYQEIGQELLLPLPSYRLQQAIDEFVSNTRAHAIKQFGLQEEIDAEVKRQVDRERKDIEHRAYEKAMNDALARVARESREAEDERARRMWNALFMGRDEGGNAHDAPEH